MGAIRCCMWPTVVGASTLAALPSIQHWSTRAERSIDTGETGRGCGEFQIGLQFQQVSWMLGSKKSGSTNSPWGDLKWLHERWLYSDSGVWGLWRSAAWSWTQPVVWWLVIRTWLLISVHHRRVGVVKLLYCAWSLLGRLGEMLSDRTPKVTRQRDTIIQDELWPWRKWAFFAFLTVYCSVYRQLCVL